VAVELSDTAQHRLQRARTRLLRGDYPGAEADALAGLDRGAGAAALETAGWAAYYRRDFPTAQGYADTGARLGSGAIRSSCLALAGRARHSNGELAPAEARLQEALAPSDPLGAVIAPAVYLGLLRSHQGRPREALELVAPATLGLHAPDFQMVTITAHMTTAHALGTLGEAAAALHAIEAWEQEMERQSASRFRGRPANFKAWVLRSLGELEQADELNQRACDEARGLTTAEAEAHGLLDLADGHLRRGHVDLAARYLDDAAPLQQKRHANRWRHELRYRLLRGRLALQVGCPEDGLTLAHQLGRDASELGVPRYRDLALLLEVQSQVALGVPVDLESVATILTRLHEHSGLEAWWLAATVAAATKTDGFWTIAEARAARLAACAGDHAATFQRYAGKRLDRMRSVASQG
jgi:tetratricopeptide (TPR) repeat protein